MQKLAEIQTAVFEWFLRVCGQQANISDDWRNILREQAIKRYECIGWSFKQIQADQEVSRWSVQCPSEWHESDQNFARRKLATAQQTKTVGKWLCRAGQLA